MIFQVTLYEGRWTKKVSEKSVRQLLKKRFYCSTFNVRQWSQSDGIVFQLTDSDVLHLVEFHISGDMDHELIIDELYHRFCSLGPEYESMIEVSVI